MSENESNDNTSENDQEDYGYSSGVVSVPSPSRLSHSIHHDSGSLHSQTCDSVALNPGSGTDSDAAHHFSVLASEVSPIDFSIGLLGPDLFSGTFIAPFSLGQAVSRDVSPSPQPDFPVSQRSRVDLLSAYVRDTATWSETTDSAMNFSVDRVHMMIKSKPYAAAAMALASRQRDTLRRQHNPMTLELYQYAIGLLIRHDPEEADALILATCTVLCVYEMMASSVTEWRRHLKVCEQSHLIQSC